MPVPSKTLRLGTRGSILARTQSQIVANAVEKAHPGVHVELVTIATSGDRIQDRPLHQFGGKGLFTREIEQSLLSGVIDFAVHSFKDLPVTMPLVDSSGLVIAAVPAREDARDVLVCASARGIDALPAQARVGTGSLRRQCQLVALRPDLRIVPVRGNIDTRLRRLREGQYDAIVLAAAGLNRAGLFDDTLMTPIETPAMLPASGQGALAIQCRRQDEQTCALLAVLNDPVTAQRVGLERALVALLGGDCHSPIGALATVHADGMRLEAAVGARGGLPPVCRAAALGAAEAVLERVMDCLEKQGARQRLLTGPPADN